ncbi:hypothetical protein MNEG_14361 [Monoraphidium neglectum]|uniref:Uncharacterized protein n=1 Tax=Monoraphidium neglectum TaxID=145388 RepID=A0A0D2J0N2_9CHLO|nr:hypothetical protein MNEG_14361 [Monoraphidium neglectum]KIY93602.1 hypothetical protein MNEG_14361 [Monoraphidium neglectum]|eukprot:XP_013892622.1 hypothetical protein MNEG_14361 [Monoraphidium neglectum]
MVQPAQPAVSAFAAAAAARFASCNLSFTAEPLELDAFIAAGAAAAAAAPPVSDKFDHNEEEDHLEELNPANMRRTSRATNAASVGYARTLSTALETAASTQLADGLVGVSGPQGKAQPFTIIRDPAVWTAKDWAAGVDELIFHVDPAAAAALKEAAAKSPRGWRT